MSVDWNCVVPSREQFFNLRLCNIFLFLSSLAGNWRSIFYSPSLYPVGEDWSPSFPYENHMIPQNPTPPGDNDCSLTGKPKFPINEWRYFLIVLFFLWAVSIECKDHFSLCKRFKKFCAQSRPENIEFMEFHCPLTCGKCNHRNLPINGQKIRMDDWRKI